MKWNVKLAIRVKVWLKKSKIKDQMNRRFVQFPLSFMGFDLRFAIKNHFDLILASMYLCCNIAFSLENLLT